VIVFFGEKAAKNLGELDSSWGPRHLEEVCPFNQTLEAESQTNELDSKNLSSGTDRDYDGISESGGLVRNSSWLVHALRHLRVQHHGGGTRQHCFSGRVTLFSNVTPSLMVM